MKIHGFDLLLTPDRFFDEKKKMEKENLLIPGLIVFIVGVIGAISAFLLSQYMIPIMIGALPGEARSFIQIMPMISAILNVGKEFVLWILVTILLFGISTPLGGSGTFKKTLEFIGFGFLPKTMEVGLGLYLTNLYITTVRISPITDMNQLENITTIIANHPIMVNIQIISLIFLLWSANLWIFGLKNARNLTTKNAIISVAVPVGVYVLYTLYRLWTVIGGV